MARSSRTGSGPGNLEGPFGGGEPPRTELPVVEGPAERRRASRSLWAACEALLVAADTTALDRALDRLREAFECDGVTLYALGASGALEPWCARGDWRT